jgi:hypothetical protein
MRHLTGPIRIKKVLNLVFFFFLTQLNLVFFGWILHALFLPLLCFVPLFLILITSWHGTTDIIREVFLLLRHVRENYYYDKNKINNYRIVKINIVISY